MRKPIVEGIGYRSAIGIFERIRWLPYPFLLDSALVVKDLGRYSIMGADPFLLFQSKGNRIEIDIRGEVVRKTGDPLEELRALLSHFRSDPPDIQIPFCGGAVGYFSYDLGRIIERIPEIACDDLQTPDIFLGFYDTAIVLDRAEGKGWIVSTEFPELGIRASERMDWLKESIRRDVDPLPAEAPFYKEGPLLLESDFDLEGYCKAVQRVKEYIAAGDVYQVNLSQRFSLPRILEPWELYKRLRRINPAPMAAFLDTGEMQVVSSSPERFLKVEGRYVETRPIKGTRPRGKDREEDRNLREELWRSEKDRAELLMIVDLERNDLGRVCRIGSVKVPELYRIEEYATVFHLVSTIVGELEEGMDFIDLLRASFPGGSITGAPKIRAMEIIEEIEPVRRGIYTGSIGYIGFDGNAQLSIVIRTLVFKGDRVYFQVGGGVVADSDPYGEYMETMDKARALIKALGVEEGAFGVKGEAFAK
jgi:para-aminobenzoate synthetase component 1